MPLDSIKLVSDVPVLPSRPVSAHKGCFGHALLIGGATGMSGAIALAGSACLRSGAGLVSLAVPEKSTYSVAALNPNYMTIPLECDGNGRLIRACIKRLDESMTRATCIAIGPGLGRSPESDEIVSHLLKNSSLPVVADADALNALSEIGHWVPTLEKSKMSRVLTPHPGEWQRLSGASSRDRQTQIEAANRLARETHAVVVLKGHHTWVTDGKSGYLNATGNSSMATGGSGDCLTGIITAFICQGLTSFDAAILGVYLHGLAGDLAHETLGTPSTLATDLIDFLPAAFRKLNRNQPA